MQPHRLSECNEVVICVKERCLLHHHVFEAVSSGLIRRHEPNLVTENHIYHKIEDLGGQWSPVCDTSEPLEGIPVVSACHFHHVFPIPIADWSCGSAPVAQSPATVTSTNKLPSPFRVLPDPDTIMSME